MDLDPNGNPIVLQPPPPLPQLKEVLQWLDSQEAAPAASFAEEPELEVEPLKRVLIVDDNADYRDALRLLLLQAGYEVYTGEDGLRGMELVCEAKPHVVITDFNMPLMNGYELVVALRSNPETTMLPIILFTGKANQRQLAGLVLGPCKFLEKPFPNEILLATIRQFVGEKRLSSAKRCDPEPLIERWPVQDNGKPMRLLEEQAASDASVKIDETDQDVEATALDSSDSDSPVIAQINKVLALAVEQGASDVHFEAEAERIVVRFRIDGSLRIVATMPFSMRRRLAVRLKIMSKLVITEKRLPQDGQIRATVNGRKVELRLSTVPSQYGENIVLRILGGAAVKDEIKDLGMNPRDLECLERAIHAPHGMILVTGPTGSGKTTTLYTLLQNLNKPDVKIVTAEDPIEREIEGITQVLARPAIGLTFERILRAFVRQDPDIILIGEIRDRETAEIAIKASITGHLVLSTLHTNNAPTTAVRLTQMGVPAYLVGASVRLVVAQRLVRMLCERCKRPAELDEEECKLLTQEEQGRLQRTCMAPGCPDCAETGFKGQTALFEVMPILSNSMRQAIQAEKADSISELAALEGMKALREAALAAVAAGQTSFREAMPLILGD